MMSFQKLVPIILSIVFATYYSQNYSSIIYKGLEMFSLVQLEDGTECTLPVYRLDALVTVAPRVNKASTM